MLTIIDYDVGNLSNLKNAFDFQNIPNQVVRDVEAVEKASHIVLPGVGAFAPAMQHLQASGLETIVKEKVAQGVPFLGVCVGMQLMLDTGEEDGNHTGLGLVEGRVKRFSHALKIPQIGWNQVAFQAQNPLLAGIPDDSYFYFVHSYHAELTNSSHALGVTDYGEEFPSIIHRDNVWGCQFHPEKSQDAGLRLLKNFSEL